MTDLLALVPPDGHVGFLDNLSFQLAGLAVVILSLSLLSLVVALAGRLLRIRKPTTSPAAATPAQPPLPSADLTPELVAVIAAAVAVTLSKPHRIVRIRAADNPWLQAWASEGRRQIFQSHHVR